MRHRGHSFFSTNAELLEVYAACETAADIIAAQNKWLEEATAGELWAGLSGVALCKACEGAAANLVASIASACFVRATRCRPGWLAKQ